MRYIGSKEKALPFIEQVVLDVIGNVNNVIFADLFCGTTCVAKHFKRLGSKLITNDYMEFSYALQVAFIKTNLLPNFSKVKELIQVNTYNEILEFLNSLNDYSGFFYKEYTQEGTKKSEYHRNYFSKENAIQIDSIRTWLKQSWDKKLINEEEFYVLLSSLVDSVTKVSNIAGTYGAFLKFDEKRKFKKLNLSPIEIIESNHNHECYCEDIFKLITKLKGDILYLDPPYNSRQYPPYYHILETVTLYDDPFIYGKTGRRPYTKKISPFCIKNQASEAIQFIIKKSKFKHILLSYNTDGILTKEEIIRLLTPIGLVEVFDQDYRRYKSNSNGNNDKELLKELLFYVRK